MALFSVMLCADPYPIGKDQGYVGISYASSEYSGAYSDKTRFHFSSLVGSGADIQNESLNLYALYGISRRGTLTLHSTYHNMSSFPWFQAPGYEGLSQTYLGYRHTYRLGRTSESLELGVRLSDSYRAGVVTAPGKGSTDFVGKWDWARVMDERHTLGLTLRYESRDPVPDVGALQIHWTRQLSKNAALQMFYNYEKFREGVVLLGNGFTLPPNSNFDQIQEMNQFTGIGLSHNIGPDWNFQATLAFRLDGENTDASRRSLSFGLGRRF